MWKLKAFKKRFVATLIFSIIFAIVCIVHGVFFDLDFSAIERLSIAGFAITFVLIFIMLLVLEWIFNIEDHEEFIKLKNKIEKRK